MPSWGGAVRIRGNGRKQGNAITDIETALGDLVVANRILANEDVLDAYGDVSVCSPDDLERFGRAPGTQTAATSMISTLVPGVSSTPTAARAGRQAGSSQAIQTSFIASFCDRSAI